MLVSTQVGKKLDPRIKRTRALLHKSFLELLDDQSFKSITVQSITDRAEVNRATFYAHFPDKFALLKDSIRQEFRQELEKHVLNACDYSSDNLVALIVTVCQFIELTSKHCKSTDSQFEVIIEAEVKQQVQELLDIWLKQTGSNRDPGIASTAASWSIYGLALRWSFDNKSASNPSADQFAKHLKALIITILGVPEHKI